MTASSKTPAGTALERGLGLKEAVALNMIDMVGIGPFIVVPFVVQAMGGPQAILAWVAGALLSLVDGFVWAELGAAMPLAGGSYVFLREAYGPARWGRVMSFLFIWQTMFQAPLVIASGAIGFAQYFTFLVPTSPLLQKLVSAGLIVLLVILLYRRITTVGKLSLFLWAGVICTFIWLIGGGITHFQPRLAFDYPAGAWDFSWVFFAGLGHASVQTIYTFLGYYNVCALGGEVRSPERTIPRSIFISIAGITLLYLTMQLSILGVVPWRDIAASPFIVSTFVEIVHGHAAASVATVLILWIAFASLFSALLGYSRIPYAAATDGTFFASFGRLHSTKHFPHVALLALGGAALLFSLLFRLTDVIKAILAMRIVVQFMGQAVGVIILRRRWPAGRLPFRMWLYPLPALLALVAWGALFLSTGTGFMLAGAGVIAAGVVVFLIRSRLRGEWPFGNPVETGSPGV